MDSVIRNVASGEVKKVVPRTKKRNQVPDEWLENEELKAAIAVLPDNYNFEIHKTIWRIVSENIKHVALQFPEGLLLYACIIADILKKFARARVSILGDVTYGACCIDDYTSSKLGAELLVHYGHSCLVPINVTKIKVMYVFVEIRFDYSHLIATIRKAFKPETRLALMGTIQFTGVLGAVHQQLLEEQYLNVFIPQAKPLSAGETLGCTSPLLSECDALVFLADGRFHLESAMIRNPKVPAYRYDPYSKIMTSEAYDVDLMKNTRMKAIHASKSAKVYGLILGTLGRQGSSAIFKRLRKLITEHGKKVVPFLMAEVNPVKLDLISEVDAWVQVACPRLSIDWGEGFNKPILTPYELEVSLNEASWTEVYPMDFYSNDGGTWANMHHRLQAQTQSHNNNKSPRNNTAAATATTTSATDTSVTSSESISNNSDVTATSTAPIDAVVQSQTSESQCCGGGGRSANSGNDDGSDMTGDMSSCCRK